ncbi:MAG: MurR/RpiR family transcriptional regulator [Hyphomicrobiales bacterium]|nr:MurR/RpiR family transcriptional regulator [Hyphomicrobiales bacterium]
MPTRAKRQDRSPRARLAKTDDVVDGLRRQYDKLTQSQKRIAEYIVENAESIAFSTVDQMATKLNVNPSTIVRFTYRLGLKGFPDLQERVRKLVRDQLSAGAKIESQQENSILAHLNGTAFGASLTQDLQNLRRTITGLSVDSLDAASEAISSANRVFVAGAFASFSAAYFLALTLDRIRGDIVLWGGERTFRASQALALGNKDCLVAFTSPPYAIDTYRVAELANEAGACVIAVTDTPISKLGQIADIVLPTHFTGSGMQNSFVASMAVANALLNGVAALDSSRTIERYGRLNKIVNRWGTFFLKSDDGD